MYNNLGDTKSPTGADLRLMQPQIQHNTLKNTV